MPAREAPCIDLGQLPELPSVQASPATSDISSASSPEPTNVRATPMFRALAMPPPEPVQPPGQEELERRIPGYRRIVIPRELTLIELLKQCSGAHTDDEVLHLREAQLRVVAERVGLRRLHVLAPILRSLTLDGSALSSLRDLGIGLTHLKILSIKRCGLTSLDGVWGLGTLRELHASGNRLQDLQPLAALQKLHTLDLAENPIPESIRLWTLGVCSSLRRLTLRGCPASDTPQYRNKVSTALPLLLYLDDHPLQDQAYDSGDELFGMPVSSDSEASEGEAELDVVEKIAVTTSSEPAAGPSSMTHIDAQENTTAENPGSGKSSDDGKRRRPATTEGAGVRPRVKAPMRPSTAQGKPAQPDCGAMSRLEIYNTLLDDEWRCSGSKLTSRAAVCGNLAHALRRPSTASTRSSIDASLSQINEETLQSAERILAAEIPVLPSSEDWEKFRLKTGIDIKLDFNDRPKSADPAEVMERLEQIEKETSERIRQETLNSYSVNQPSTSRFQMSSNATVDMRDILSLDVNTWRCIETYAPSSTGSDANLEDEPPEEFVLQMPRHRRHFQDM